LLQEANLVGACPLAATRRAWNGELDPAPAGESGIRQHVIDQAAKSRLQCGGAETRTLDLNDHSCTGVLFTRNPDTGSHAAKACRR